MTRVKNKGLIIEGQQKSDEIGLFVGGQNERLFQFVGKGFAGLYACCIVIEHLAEFLKPAVVHVGMCVAEVAERGDFEQQTVCRLAANLPFAEIIQGRIYRQAIVCKIKAGKQRLLVAGITVL